LFTREVLPVVQAMDAPLQPGVLTDFVSGLRHPTAIGRTFNARFGGRGNVNNVNNVEGSREFP